MDTYVDDQRGVVQVFGFDGHGIRYMVTEVAIDGNPGWRHEVLARLRDGDYRRGEEFMRRWEKEREAKERDVARQRADLVGAMAEHAEWAIRRDLPELGRRIY